MVFEDKIYIQYEKDAEYPTGEECYSPSVRYPEYSFPGMSDTKNDVYGMVRDGLYHMGMDKSHYGKREWNPLGDIIAPGDNVLIKPNLVSHTNPVDGMDCLVTHPAVLRAVIDYALIALQGTGQVTVADAPVQSCDFGQLMLGGGYQRITDFYRNYGINVQFVDMRGTKSKRDKDGVLWQEEDAEQKAHAILVDLGNESAFSDCTEERLNKLRITNYAPNELNVHHREGKHEYLISDYVLNADVVINIPKPKTHRKAGVTGAQKNMVGINVEKSCLPHHTYGGKNSGGDEYPFDSWYTRTQSWLHDHIDAATKEKKFREVKQYSFLLTCVLAFGKLTGIKKKHLIREGSWSGNDTIWRTVSDLNKILLYADAEGHMCDSQQRKLFTIADMIVCGEGEGPLMPSTYQMGLLLFGSNSLNIDKVIAGIWGIDWKRIPCISNTLKQKSRLRIPCGSAEVSSNEEKYNIGKIDRLNPGDFKHITMPSGWRDV